MHYSYGPLHMAKQKQDDQLEHTYSSYVRIRDVALKTCQSRWMMGRSGERGSGISVLVARHDDDDDIKAKMIIHNWTNVEYMVIETKQLISELAQKDDKTTHNMVGGRWSTGNCAINRNLIIQPNVTCTNQNPPWKMIPARTDKVIR